MVGEYGEANMPYENGKMNWWAIVAIAMGLVGSIVGFSFSEIRNTDRELLRTLIKQVTEAQIKHEQDQQIITAELKRWNEKQDIMLAELKDNYKTLCWAVSMPFNDRKKQFNLSPFHFNNSLEKR
jgi:hypothetical protein